MIGDNYIPGIGIDKETTISLVFVLFGLGMAVLGITKEKELIMILISEILVAFGGIIVAFGGIIGITKRYNKISVTHAFWIPIGVSVALGIQLAYDLSQLGGLDAIRIALKPTKGALVSGSFWLPLGVALKNREFPHAIVAGIGGIIVYVLIIAFHLPPSLQHLSFQSVLSGYILVLLLGLPLLILGYYIGD